MHKEYIELYQTYTQKYGKKTAIFLMVGSFYELYDIQDKETGETQGNIKEITELLGIQLSTKKGDFPDNCDGLFAGFPEYVMHKWAGRLTSAGWTVVIVDQIKDMRGKVKERKVSSILSPSTHIENTLATDTPYIMTLFFHQQGGSPPQFGAASLDLTTGTSHTYSGQAQGRPDIWTTDDLVQLMSVFAPKELVIYWNSSTNPIPDETFFKRLFRVSSVPCHLRTVETTGAFSKELVRKEYLQKLYSIKSLLPPATYLGLRTEYEELSLVYLLQFVEEHVPSILKSLHRNEPWIPQARLICGNHALTQLQMTGVNQQESVIGLFDKSITPMGKRAIKERLLSPSSYASEIQLRLNEVQDYLQWPNERTKILERQLRFMCDIPRLHRKLLCGIITPQEISSLFQTYSATAAIMKQVTATTLLQEPFTQEQWNTYLATFHYHFTEEKALQANADQTAFNVIHYVEIGQKEKEIQDILQQFQVLRHEMSTKGGVSEESIRLEEREKEPYGLKGSTITLQQLKKNSAHLPEGTKLSELKSGGWIDCKKLQQLNISLQRLRESLIHLVAIHLADACVAIAEAGNVLWHDMEQWISHVDSTQCIGRVSKERGWSCPIIESAEHGSSLDIKQVRHPLVEAAASRVAYVSHDVALNQETKGWLVYGMNASGKSTLMKATGLCVLLAQAGCFVPAKEMTLRPFQAVYTRILNQDNLFAGLSSFAVEMSELRDILRNANDKTLVLGDELCSGTESTSAQALVASGIKFLSDKRATFMFATHLHDLATLIDIKALGVQVWHLHVEYDPVHRKLIYDRSLRPGNGSTLYGLEVARAMDLPFEFIEQALEYRHKLTSSITQEAAKGSQWNKEIVRRDCEVCKKTITKELEVHHIEARATAIHNRLENGTHMNDKRNLVVICQACHDAIHANEITIQPLQMTSDGPERNVQYLKHVQQDYPVKQVSPKKGKWTEEEMEIMMKTLRSFSSLSLKSVRAHLSAKYGIEVSEGVLGKMRKE
jgi:DNA mismatch repair protein MutS